MLQVGKYILETKWSKFGALALVSKGDAIFNSNPMSQVGAVWQTSVLWEKSTHSPRCLISHAEWFIAGVVERTPFKADGFLCGLVTLLWVFNLNLNVSTSKPFCFSFSVAPPTRLRYNVISHDSIQISWKAPRGKFGGYKLLVAPASGKDNPLCYLGLVVLFIHGWLKICSAECCFRIVWKIWFNLVFELGKFSSY